MRPFDFFSIIYLVIGTFYFSNQNLVFRLMFHDIGVLFHSVSFACLSYVACAEPFNLFICRICDQSISFLVLLFIQASHLSLAIIMHILRYVMLC